MMKKSERPIDPAVAAREAGRIVAENFAKPRSRRQRRRQRTRAPPGDDDDEADASSVLTFCKRHGISLSFFYKLKELGLAPQTMTVGKRVLVSRESAARWRAAREKAAEAAATAA
jgi:hypothetical protein